MSLQESDSGKGVGGVRVGVWAAVMVARRRSVVVMREKLEAFSFTFPMEVLSSKPAPADAKLAPMRRFFPEASGLRYVGGYVVKPSVSAVET
ncbi:hypothetical protein L2E82_15049 [Cichorium intybus]|uniref:Uncharacterized protein n=1 Tax=Cichorium intybus TaxID=13427 RepID=A0ACB9F2C0_CICIN|nr:hypothetical protein L2E82_15049 [Cichorium intybus]